MAGVAVDEVPGGVRAVWTEFFWDRGGGARRERKVESERTIPSAIEKRTRFYNTHARKRRHAFYNYPLKEPPGQQDSLVYERVGVLW